MPWDYSIYPDLTETQEHVLTVIGETLYMIQMAEDAIQNCCTYVFQDESDLLEKLYSKEKQDRKRTLGQIVSVVRKQVEVHPQFDVMLTTFVDKRNFFVHTMFNDAEFGLQSDELCKRTEEFLLDLQDYAWNIQNIFLGCLMNWMRQSGVHEHLPQEIKENKHLGQVEQKSFNLLFRDKQ